jgi:hypothetical protein
MANYPADKEELKVNIHPKKQPTKLETLAKLIKEKTKLEEDRKETDKKLADLEPK